MIRAVKVLALAIAPTGAMAFELAFPLDCTLGQTCFIQQYVDHDPGAGAADFTCGSLSYDGHKGTDFALHSLAAMRQGVTVRAAAPGKVRGIRDGMPDIGSNTPGAPALEGRDCGNGVLIEHVDGWQTQYCHMKSGSIAVKSGEVVATGAALGQVGLSGRTEFPHLHVTLRQHDRVIDPFAPDKTQTCGNPPADDLWANPISYQAGGLITTGFAVSIPEFAAIKVGLSHPETLPSDAPALVLWAYAYGARAGDRMDLRIKGPNGEIIAQTVTLDRNQAQLFRAAGKRLTKRRWATGDYSGTTMLRRGGSLIAQSTVTLTIP